MILQSLYKLYDRLADDPAYGIAKPGYSPQKISFRVVLKPDGTLFAIQDARVKNDNGKLFAGAQVVLGEAKPSGSGFNPCLLWDNTTYMLGYKLDDPKPERTLKSFEAFRDKHLALETEINDADFSAICRFLEKWTPEQASKYVEAHPAIKDLATGFGLFQIQGQAQSINEKSEILKWWDRQAPETAGDVGQCLITGDTATIARLHPKIKSVAGAQSAGASIVSFNAPAYESYGKDQSFNAPVSEQAAFKYGTALNSLLNGPKSNKHRIRIGDTTCVFWTDQPSIVEDAIPFYFSNGSNTLEAQDEAARSKVEIFLKSLRLGTQVLDELGEDTQNNHFYILGLAPNAARLSVRFFHQSTVAEFVSNLRAHHNDISIIRQFEEAKDKRHPDPEFPANWQLLKETARVSDEIPPLLGGALMRAILDNTPYPEGIYSAVIRRIRADRTINYFRAAIIKGVLTRNHQQTISTMLDTENKEPAYLLGRLFSTLEKTQGDALGDLNAGLKDKYYSSASATPASVYPRILRTYPHHLAKLNGGQKVVRERLIQDIIGELNEFPSHLNLKDQGKFAIGYYHQRKAFFTKKPTDSPEPQESK
jgi:CRISPR-associated protein Csd1